MIARGLPKGRLNRRGIGVPVSSPSALSFVALSAVLQYVRADSGITLVSGRVDTWNDISGQAWHYTQGTAGNRPLHSASGGPNGTPLVQLDDVARYMSSSLVTPLRTTTPTTVWFVGRQVSWTNGRRIISDTTNLKKLVYQEGTTPQIDLFDGASVGNNAGGTIGSFARYLVDWTVLPGDCRLKVGSSNITALNPSSQVADVGRLIGNNAGSSAVFDFCELLYMNRALTAGEETALDSYVTSRYGAGVLI